MIARQILLILELFTLKVYFFVRAKILKEFYFEQYLYLG